MNKGLLAITFYNIVILVVFLALAIVFKHWWIILFSVFFIASFPVTVHKYRRKCDGCGISSVAMDTYDQALDRAIKDGWKHYEETNTDYCPSCQTEMFKEK